jgi:hypothetical protein
MADEPSSKITDEGARDEQNNPAVTRPIAAAGGDNNGHQDTEYTQRYPTQKKHDRFDWISLFVLIATCSAAFGAACEAKRLADSTDKLVIDAEDTAKRQLRAYVSFEEGGRITCGTLGCGIDIRIKNSGQTPAYNVTCYVASESRDTVFDPITDQNFRNFQFSQTGIATVDLGSGQEWTISNCTQGPSIVGLSEKTGKTLYAWGVVKFRDAFNRCQRTAFIAKESSGLTFLWQSASDPIDDSDCDSGNPRRSIFPAPEK